MGCGCRANWEVGRATSPGVGREQPSRRWSAFYAAGEGMLAPERFHGNENVHAFLRNFSSKSAIRASRSASWSGSHATSRSASG
jgi:hypothetical protein